jgi:prepilin-type processing-associated H-X9-DG protein
VNPPFVIAPKSDNSNAAELQKRVSEFDVEFPNRHVEELPDAVFLGSRRTFERLKRLEPYARPELVEAFRAAGDTAIQFLLLPTHNDRRVIDELMPTLPNEIGGGSSTVLTRGVQWLALGINAPPKVSLQLAIQSEDREAATALRAKWLEVTRLFSRQEIPLKALPDIDKAFALLTPEVKGDRLVLGLGEPDRSIQALLATITPLLEQMRNHASRQLSSTNLKQIALAMHNFYDIHKRFPAIGTFDATGKPLLSWRVHILPFVEQQQLYKEFRLDDPWDSEHNRKLIEKMPELFRCPASKHKRSSGLATYRVVVGEHTAFPGHEGIEIKQITDGTSNTIMVVEVDDGHGVTWTKPEGLPYNEANPAEGLGGQFEGGFNCAFCDGSVQFLELPHDPERLRRLLLRDDGKAISR